MFSRSAIPIIGTVGISFIEAGVVVVQQSVLNARLAPTQRSESLRPTERAAVCFAPLALQPVSVVGRVPDP